ncbi:histidine phosphatase family protein [uncultured Roseobacter sp.]|uniref:SixA phosphatase family protein n=1 Tax=uncultured Roseobacter sp. TaxID=114847 RepID=UPI00260E5C28|nr:histidine phosphatase family protein [uncultured Roseobacter sp.]
MHRLILMRHAKSDWSHTGLRDFDRPLNARGQQAAKRLGRWLGETPDCLPDTVLCSSARRTRETLAGLSLAEGADVRLTDALYHATADQMRHVLRQATGTRVLMIGHNPGIADLARRIVVAPPEHPRFDDYPTGATLVVDLEITGWHAPDMRPGKVVDFVVPRELP